MNLLPSGNLMIVIAVLLLCSSVGAQDLDKNRRMVTEHQLLHDKGKAVEQLRRLLWLSSAMRSVHTAQRRRWARWPLHAPPLVQRDPRRSAQQIRSLGAPGVLQRS
ncbi:parathyroid hormone 4-like isoform X2 [Mobula hypostoma]